MNHSKNKILDTKKNQKLVKEIELFIKKNGYFIIRNVLGEKECEEYIEEAHRLSKGTVQEQNLYRRFKKFLEMVRD